MAGMEPNERGARRREMIGMMGVLGMAAAAVGSLAVSVAAGLLLLKGALRMIESSMPRQASAVAGVADFAEYARRSTGSLPADVVEFERAA
jgi:hypothetical protein